MATRRPSSLRPLGILLLAVVVATTVPVAVLAAVLPRFAIPPPPPLRIESVSVSPDPPVPFGDVTVTARLSKGGSAIVGLGYVVGFARTFAGGGSMLPVASRVYERSLGPFEYGTEVWFVVVAALGDEVARSDFGVFQVGPILRGGPSGLRIDSVVQTPAQPRPGDSVIVSANITSNGNFTEAAAQMFQIVPGTAIGDVSLMTAVGTNFTGRVYAYPSALVAYRIVAWDPTGNTAVSDVYTFEVPAPGPVP